MRPLSTFLRALVALSTTMCQAANSQDDFLRVTTEHGVLQGTLLPSATRSPVAAFLGVPYARPPTGNLRFRPPLSPIPWEGARLAETDPPSCYQQRELFFGGDFDGSREEEPSEPPSEDCLYLNVYVPVPPSPPQRSRGATERNNTLADDEVGEENANGLPVMVWFHGGGFSRGSSSPRGPDGGGGEDGGWRPDPRELAAQGGVIAVSVQYRLGALGFLFLDDESAPGNAGLMDQRAALEWVRRNVFAFGGDPTRVTLAGQGAGAVSAAIQLASAREKGVEPAPKRLILQSGGLVHPWSFSHPARSFTGALRLASLLGCPASGSKRRVAECLANASPEDIVNRESGVTAPGEGPAPGGPVSHRHPFSPTIDGDLVAWEPREMLRRALENAGGEVKVLMGGNADEGTKALMYLLPALFPNRELGEKEEGLTKGQFEEAVDRMFQGSSQQLRSAARFQYTNWTSPSSAPSRFSMAARMVADSQFDCPAEEFASTAVSGGAEVFRYKFSVRDPLDPWPAWTGVKRGDELGFVFGRPVAQPDRYGQVDKTLSRFMLQSWANFVKTGHPAGRGRGRSIGWPRFNGPSGHLLLLTPGRDVVVVNSASPEEGGDRTKENCAFWDRLAKELEEESGGGEKCGGKEREGSSQKKRRKGERPKKFRPLKIKSRKPSIIDSDDYLRPKRRTTYAPPTTSSTTTTALPTLTSSEAEEEPRSRSPPLPEAVGVFSQVLSSSPYFLPPPVNSLSRHTPLSGADVPEFKLVDSTVVVNSEPSDEKMQVSRGSYHPQQHAERRSGGKPESTLLSYQLSVVDSHPPIPLRAEEKDKDSDRRKSQVRADSSPSVGAGATPDEWKLYRPEEPGNSPIYIAKGVYKAAPDRRHRPPSPQVREEDNEERRVEAALIQALYEQQRKQELEREIYDQQREMQQRQRQQQHEEENEQSVYFGAQPRSKRKPISSSSSNGNNNSNPRGGAYDPFNPSTYTRAILTKRMGGIVEEPEVATVEAQLKPGGEKISGRQKQFYFPNYIPSYQR